MRIYPAAGLSGVFEPAWSIGIRVIRRFFWQKRVVKARMVYKTNRYHL